MGAPGKGWVHQERVECSREKGMSASGKGGVLGKERMSAPGKKEWMLWGRDGWSREGVGGPGKGKVLLGRRAGSCGASTCSSCAAASDPIM